MMFCEHCGTQIEKDAQFCSSCGKSTSVTVRPVTITTATAAPSTMAEAMYHKEEVPVVKCQTCGHEGDAEKNRSTVMVVLAWLCILVAPLITLLYFAFTDKYCCSNCKSTKLAYKDAQGVFVTPKKTKRSPLLIIVWIILGIFLMGVLASIILATINS
jgi:RsiW-degrading membrane proteinase PrsW (M82 family)